jgi:hypothetical protein
MIMRTGWSGDGKKNLRHFSRRSLLVVGFLFILRDQLVGQLNRFAD